MGLWPGEASNQLSEPVIVQGNHHYASHEPDY